MKYDHFDSCNSQFTGDTFHKGSPQCPVRPSGFFSGKTVTSAWPLLPCSLDAQIPRSPPWFLREGTAFPSDRKTAGLGSWCQDPRAFINSCRRSESHGQCVNQAERSWPSERISLPAVSHLLSASIHQGQLCFYPAHNPHISWMSRFCL